ncbi:MAG: PrgI family protein [Candidatus Woesebacteria bacterium]|jgi:hypothetical protein
MREHPIPQDITGYRFHIIGSMTIKQFAEIFLGVIGAIIFYATNLLPFIKYPLMLLSFVIGLALAFLPIEERPLDHWLTTFLKVLYKPTQFFWKREAFVPTPFLYERKKIIKEQEAVIDLTPARRQRIKEYLSSINKQSSIQDWEDTDQEKVNNIMASFQTVQVNYSNVKKMKQKPQLKTRVRTLKAPEMNQAVINNTDNNTAYTNQTDTITTSQPVNQNTISVTTQSPSKQEKQIFPPLANQVAAAKVATDKGNTQLTNNKHLTSNLSLPPKPTEANKIVGAIVNPNNEIIADAIIEIENSEGEIVRAIKSNSLGHFFTSTPLENDDYLIKVEKDQLQFPTQKVVAKGKIIDPIVIKSLN